MVILFYPIITLMMDSFSYTPLNAAFLYSIKAPQYAGMHHIKNDVLFY